MSLRGLVFVFVVGIASFAASAEVVIVPASPKFGEPVHVTTPTGLVGNYMPSSTTVTMSGNTITVAVGTISFETAPGLSFLDVVIGRFPTGSYDVKVVTAGDFSGQLGTGHFVVADRDTGITAPLYDYTDMWWTPTSAHFELTPQLLSRIGRLGEVAGPLPRCMKSAFGQ